MKKALCLIMAVFMLAMLFAACNNDSSSSSTTAPPASTTTTAPPTSSGNTAATTTEAPPATADDLIDGMYNLAVRADGSTKYDVDARGIPTAPWDYVLPISTNTEEVFTFWTTTYQPQMVYTEDFKDMPFQTALREMTGVNIDYLIIASSAMREQFGVMLASDDLADLMSSAYSYYTGSALQGIEEGYFANLYDWKEYIPNFIHQVTRWEERGDEYAYDKIFYLSDVIRGMGLGTEEPMPGSGYCVRADWLERIGKVPTDIVTYDDVYEMLKAFKVEIGADCYPMGMMSVVEIAAAIFAGGYNTTAMCTTSGYPAIRILDGTPVYTLTREDDLEILKIYNKFLSEGLIDPDWTSYSLTTDMRNALDNNRMGYMSFNPSELGSLEASSTDPNCRWDSMPWPRQTVGQTIQYGQAAGLSGCPSGAAGGVISASCENIPVLASWVDYGYSPEGSLFKGWGIEGETWEYDANGNRMLTDFVLNNPDGHDGAWLLMVYAMNAFMDPGMQYHTRVYAYPGGERYVKIMSEIWMEKDYKGTFDWPSTLRLDTEAQAEVNSFAADIGTYKVENYLAFVDGSKPLSEWDSYVSAMMNMGMARAEEIYLARYQQYLADKAARG